MNSRVGLMRLQHVIETRIWCWVKIEDFKKLIAETSPVIIIEITIM